MAKIRTIKEGFWTDDLLVQCSFVARLFFIGLWQFADDDGVFEWRPLTLKMKIFPNDEIQVADLLDDLLAKQLIARFDHDGKSFGIVRNFAKHQRIDNRFRKSTIEDLTKVDLCYTSARVNTRDHAGKHAGRGGGGGGGSGEELPPSGVAALAAPPAPEVVDPVEDEYRKFLPIAAQVFRHKKLFTEAGLKKWRARRKTFSAREIGEAFLNLQQEPDRWKIQNNGWREMSWWLSSDDRIREMKNCHLKGAGARTVRSV